MEIKSKYLRVMTAHQVQKHFALDQKILSQDLEKMPYTRNISMMQMHYIGQLRDRGLEKKSSMMQ